MTAFQLVTIVVLVLCILIMCLVTENRKLAEKLANEKLTSSLEEVRSALAELRSAKGKM